MGQVQTFARTNAQTHRSYHPVRSQSIYSKRLQHQGLLILRPVPFKNCIQIQTSTGSFFLQNIQITLKDLLESRLYTNKLFPKQDIQRLIENVTYTLAFLAENGVQYKDVTAENVFYDEGGFKLLPNQLIPEQRYQRFLSSRMSKKPSTHTSTTSTNTQQPPFHHQPHQQFLPISPQMIIAFRCKQPTITQPDILDKSNVFTLGLLLLQTCTLLPSYQCFDQQTCDILDEVITERIQLVKEFYSQQIASIVANMLDYDYSERMGLKEVSIFVNRGLNKDLITNSKIVKQLSNKKTPQQRPFIDLPLTSSDPTLDEAQSVVNHSHTKSAISKSRVQQTEQAATESRFSRPSHNVSVTEKKRNKTNKVYMNGGVQIEQQEEEPVVHQVNKEERNRVYMRQQGQGKSQQQQNRQIELNKVFGNNDFQGRTQQQQQEVLKQIPHQSNLIITSSTNDSRMLQPQQPSSSKPLSFNMRQKYTPPLPTFTQKPSPYHYNQNNQQDAQNRYPQDPYPQRQIKRKNSTDYLGYRAPAQQRLPLQANNNNNNESTFYHGKFDSLEEVNEDSGSRGYFQGAKNGKSSNNINGKGGEFHEQDNSLSRIKSQIERSRKLIEEFKRGENLQFS